MKVAIIGAMDIEVKMLWSSMTDRHVEKYAGMEFAEGRLCEKAAVVVRCGIGKVRAGMCVQILKDHYAVTHIVNTGAAGSLNPRLHIGEIVISKDAVYHDVDATAFGYAPGEIPQMHRVAYEADIGLIHAAEKAAMHGDLPFVQGRIATGDRFVSDIKEKIRIRETFHADCCEMEGAAIAQASFLNGLPFVILRSISDQADGSDLSSYEEFEKKAAENSARIVLDMMRESESWEPC